MKDTQEVAAWFRAVLTPCPGSAWFDGSTGLGVGQSSPSWSLTAAPGLATHTAESEAPLDLLKLRPRLGPKVLPPP